MPVFIAALLGGLVSAAGSLVGRVLIALSIGYVSYTGLDLLLAGVRTFILENFATLPPEALSVLSALRVDVCISIALSACAARLVLSGITSGKLTKMVIK